MPNCLARAISFSKINKMHKSFPLGPSVTCLLPAIEAGFVVLSAQSYYANQEKSRWWSSSLKQTGFSSLAAGNFKRGSGSRSFCFETSDPIRNITCYAKQASLVARVCWWRGGGLGRVSQPINCSRDAVSCLHQWEEQQRSMFCYLSQSKIIPGKSGRRVSLNYC